MTVVMELLQLQADQGPPVWSALHRCAGERPGSGGRGRVVAGVRGCRRSGVYRSVRAVPLRLCGEAIGTLNLFFRQPGALPGADLRWVRR